MIYILNIYHVEDKAKWNQIVKSFANWDVYYLNEYARSFQLHGDGDPMLIEYQDENTRFCYVVMVSDIGRCSKFNNRLELGKFFDMETPYGYGGPLCDSESISSESQHQYYNEVNGFCFEKGIVSQFVRFHPLLENHNLLSEVIDTRELKDSIFIDTSSQEIIWSNLDSKNRNMIRKAQKNGIIIRQMPVSEYKSFVDLYNETMIKDEADEYYFFDEKYFESQKDLNENACIFYAYMNDQPVSGAIIYYNEKYMHYHLAGSNTRFRKFAPNNLLLYEAASWACEHGIKKMHLGGGIVADDNLFGFKKQFNKNGRLPFVIGKTVFNQDVYDRLKVIRKQIDNSFNENNSFMIQYRA